jgi:hypothetical protein
METPSFFRTLAPVFSAGFCLIGISSQAGAEIRIDVASDTFLTEHPGQGGTGSNQGSGESLSAIGAPFYRAYPLFTFDLSSLAGLTVVGSPRVELYLTGGHTGSEGVARTVSLHEAFVAWDEATVTWDTFGASPGVQFGGDISAAVATETVDWAGGAAGVISWDLPIDLVQGWVDNAATNFGLLLINQNGTVQVDLGFAARESTIFPPAALVLTVIPEPASAGVIAGLGALAMVGGRIGRRCRQVRK